MGETEESTVGDGVYQGRICKVGGSRVERGIFDRSLVIQIDGI
jgi:hypothetical protein